MLKRLTVTEVAPQATGRAWQQAAAGLVFEGSRVLIEVTEADEMGMIEKRVYGRHHNRC